MSDAPRTKRPQLAADWLARWRDLTRSKRTAGGIALLLLVTLWFTSESEARGEQATWSREQILNAIWFVESSGRENPPDGDGGRAIGPYQIHYVYWLDATGFDDTLGGDYQDCRQRRYAERVIAAYMQRYAREAWQSGDAQTIARVHNGGPRGHQKQATLGYWQRVHKRLTNEP